MKKASHYFLLALVLCAGLVVSPAQAQQVLQFPGLTPVGTTAGSQAVTVNFSAAGSISSIKVRTQGVDGYDYTNAGGGTCSTSMSYSAGQTCTVLVGFTPKAPGERRGAVVLVNSNGGVLGTALMDGFASGAVGVFIPGEITTVAGSSVWIYNGEGVATQSPFFLPFGVTLDAAGNLYITDTSNTRIRKVDAVTGMTSTIAGNGTIGGTGDGGPATSATLSSPSSVALDGAGNVFISDTGNNVIRKVNVFDGTISTIAGQMGKNGYVGDGGPASSAKLNGPNGLVFDAQGNLYFCDTNNNVVRRIDAGTGVITTFAGNGVTTGGYGDGGPAAAAMLNAPWGIAVSSKGEIYIADQGNSLIRKVVNGTISTVAGTHDAADTGSNPPAIHTQLNSPAGVVVDVAGNLYISDSGNNLIRKVNTNTGVISTIGGGTAQSTTQNTNDNGPATQGSVYGPYTLALDAQGSLYISDVFENRIRKISSNLAVLKFPTQRVGRVSAPLPQILENDGNADLNISTVLGVQQAKVDAGSTTCVMGTPLAALSQCVIGAEFAPTQVGTVIAGTLDASSDASNSPAEISLQGQVLDVDPSTVTLTSNTNPSLAGQVITFVATATSVGTTPTGEMDLMDGTTQVATGTLQPGGTISFNVSTLAVGTHAMTAVYSGDSSNSNGTSAVVSQIVKPVVAPTATSLGSNINPLNAGATVQFTATVTVVTAGSGTGEITGSVVFSDGVNQLGSSNIVNGMATLNVSTLSVGTHNVIATYSGSTSYSTSKSVAVVEIVQTATSKTALSTASNPSTAGAALTLTATILTTGGTATGPVSFLDGTTVLGSATLNKQGVATLVVPGSAWTVGTHPLTANYGGDSFDTGSISPGVSQIVNVASTSSVVTSSLNPVGLGGSVTFTATVTSNGGGQATGTVQFMDGTALLGSGTLNAAGATTFTTSTLALGSHPITVVYGGDAYDSGSSSVSMTEVVQSATINIAFATSGNPVTFGTALVLNAKVAGSGSQPVGTVIFTDGGLSIGTATLDANGAATITTSTLAIGSHPLVAVYGGDTNHASVTSTGITESVMQVTTTALSASTQSQIAGLPVQWTINVVGANAKALTGSVTISDNGTLVTTLPLDATGAASYSSSSLTPGQHSMVAKYSGDANDQVSASTPAVTTINTATTTTTFTTNANPVFTGTPIVFTAVVTGNGGTPTGSVQFLDGTTVLQTVPVVTANGATTASMTLSTLAAGIHKLSASYTGDTLDHSSVSSTINEQIAQKTSITIASSANPSLLTDDVSFTVTVSNGVTGSVPTGTVTLTDGGTAVGSLALNGSGVATFTLQAPALGAHTLVASYAGDNSNSPATTAPLVQTVVLRPSTNTFSTSTTALSAGQSVTLISVVQGVGPKAPTGSVTFAAGGIVLGTAPINATGVATLSVTPIQATYKIVSTYSGDSLYAPSDSAAITVVVGPTIEFTINMTPSSMTIKSGDHGTLQIAITTASTFTDTLALGCAGLPTAATCTFSQNEIKVSNGLATTVTVIVDTGNPLGAGANVTAKNEHGGFGGNGVLACMLPAGLLAMFFGRKRIRRPLGLLVMMLLLGSVAGLSGCANSFSMTDTPAGSYTFQIVGSGNATGATQAGTVKLTVTQ
ncbi:Ig-like domain repeat protein [Granulicella tundricola]|nr:Ig-like domain repeat protein [Granulicella tundricola]